jgi:hypothetical protein
MKQSMIPRDCKYLLYCFQSLSHYCQSYPKYSIAKLNGKTYPQLTFHTRTLECIKELYSYFYLNGKKIVPNNLYDFINF